MVAYRPFSYIQWVTVGTGLTLELTSKTLLDSLRSYIARITRQHIKRIKRLTVLGSKRIIDRDSSNSQFPKLRSNVARLVGLVRGKRRNTEIRQMRKNYRLIKVPPTQSVE